MGRHRQYMLPLHRPMKEWNARAWRRLARPETYAYQLHNKCHRIMTQCEADDRWGDFIDNFSLYELYQYIKQTEPEMCGDFFGLATLFGEDPTLPSMFNCAQCKLHDERKINRDDIAELWNSEGVDAFQLNKLFSV